ncbi:hypothetical protein SNE40_002193 [Patella caerulea]|uniref:Reelin domain-containing protein n=1 Tax=Patella caerulea TaxID=87958 RepID=A0AAN8K6R5_PATCE
MLSFVVIVCTIGAVTGYASGPPTSACADMYPTGHETNAQTGTPYFEITTAENTYSAGGTVTVTLTATSNYYEGVFVQARRATSNCSDGTNDGAVGSFTIPNGDTFLQLISCNGIAGGAVAHKTSSHQTSKTITWTAPAQTVGQIYFRGVFVRNEETFWTDIFSSVVKPTGDTSTDLTVCPVRTTLNGSGANRPIAIVILLSTIITVLSRGV